MCMILLAWKVWSIYDNVNLESLQCVYEDVNLDSLAAVCMKSLTLKVRNEYGKVNSLNCVW